MRMNVEHITLLEIIAQSAGKHRETAETKTAEPDVSSAVPGDTAKPSRRPEYSGQSTRNKKPKSIDSLLKMLKQYAE